MIPGSFLVGFVGKAGVNFFISYRLFIRIPKSSINLKKSGIYG